MNERIPTSAGYYLNICIVVRLPLVVVNPDAKKCSNFISCAGLLMCVSKKLSYVRVSQIPSTQPHQLCRINSSNRNKDFIYLGLPSISTTPSNPQEKLLADCLARIATAKV